MKYQTTTIALTLVLSISAFGLPHHGSAGRHVDFHSVYGRSPALANFQPGHTNGMSASLNRRTASLVDDVAEFQGYQDLSKRDAAKQTHKHQQPKKEEDDDCSDELEEEEFSSHRSHQSRVPHGVTAPYSTSTFSTHLRPQPARLNTDYPTKKSPTEKLKHYGVHSEPAHTKAEALPSVETSKWSEASKKQLEPPRPKAEALHWGESSRWPEVPKPKLDAPTDIWPSARPSSMGVFSGATQSSSASTGQGGSSGFTWSSETSGSTTSTGSSSSSFGGDIFTGKATFFTQDNNAGACGVKHSDHDFIVAIQNKMYKHGELCGKKIAITRHSTGQTIYCVAADECPGCSTAASLDLSVAAFDALGRPDEGVIDISWKIVE